MAPTVIVYGLMLPTAFPKLLERVWALNPGQGGRPLPQEHAYVHHYAVSWPVSHRCKKQASDLGTNACVVARLATVSTTPSASLAQDLPPAAAWACRCCIAIIFSASTDCTCIRLFCRSRRLCRDGANGRGRCVCVYACACAHTCMCALCACAGVCARARIRAPGHNLATPRHRREGQGQHLSCES